MSIQLWRLFVGEMCAVSNECLISEKASLSRLYTVSIQPSSGFVSTKSAKAVCFFIRSSSCDDVTSELKVNVSTR